MRNLWTRIRYWWCRKFHHKWDGHGRSFVEFGDEQNIGTDFMEWACEVCGRNYDVKTKWRQIGTSREPKFEMASREVTYRGICFPIPGEVGSTGPEGED